MGPCKKICPFTKEIAVALLYLMISDISDRRCGILLAKFCPAVRALYCVLVTACRAVRPYRGRARRGKEERLLLGTKPENSV